MKIQFTEKEVEALFMQLLNEFHDNIKRMEELNEKFVNSQKKQLGFNETIELIKQTSLQIGISQEKRKHLILLHKFFDTKFDENTLYINPI